MKKLSLNFWSLDKPIEAFAENVGLKPGWIQLIQADGSSTIIPSENIVWAHLKDFVPPAPASEPAPEPAPEPPAEASPEAEVPASET